MYARGMSTREITGHLHELYGIDVSPDLISTVTDAVLEEVTSWQQRPLDPAYPLVFFDAIRVSDACRQCGALSRTEAATKAWFAAKPSISPWVPAPMVARRCWGYGSNRMKGPSSGPAS